jgi:hypothetical protein
MVRNPHRQPDGKNEAEDVGGGKAAKRSGFERVFRNPENENRA